MTVTLYIPRGGPVARDVDVIRATNEVVDNDAPSATETHSPDWNGHESYTVESGGISPNQLGPYTTASEQYVPFIGNANTDFSAPINNQVSTSGTAAQREMAGQQGHGSLQVQESLEPTIVAGREFGELYFTAHRPPIQGATNEDMSPTVTDPVTTAALTQQARRIASRQQQASLYGAFLKAATS